MANRPIRFVSSSEPPELTSCCAEAQADGVPCPTLGRSCEICERAVREGDSELPLPPIRPAGCD